MKNNLILSIFPGIDLLGMAFEEQGYCVVRGPDLLWGGDIKSFHPPAGVFEGVIGGPPCIGESNLAYLNGNVGYSLWGEAMRVIKEAQSDWWLLEAVIKHEAPYCVKLSPRYLGEKQSRRRYFHSNLNIAPYIEVSLFENPVYKHTVVAGHEGKVGEVSNGIAKYSIEEACVLQGLPALFMQDKPFLATEKFKVVGNGVPLCMGRAIAKAIRKATALPSLDNHTKSETDVEKVP